MNLSENLTLSEMVNSDTAKRLGIDNNPTSEHLENLKAWAVNIFQPCRNHFGIPIHINSGYRSKKLNEAVPGSSKTSQHSTGQAGDIDMDNTSITNAQLFHWIKDNLEFDQLIWEFGTSKNPDWVHVSFVAKGKGKNRKQVLIGKKIAGKTTYLNF